MSVLAWLIGSELGRKTALAGITVLMILAVIARIYSAGKNAEKARQKELELDLLKKRLEVDDEITKLSPDRRRERLREWVRNN